MDASLLLLTLIGFLAALMGSMLGLGGGFVLVPMLTLLGTPMHEAVGTSLTAIVFNSAMATYTYSRKGLTRFKLGLTLELATVPGAILGSLIALSIDEKTLKIIFAVFLVFVAYRMFVRKDSGEYDVKLKHIALGYLSCFFVGTMSGMLGVGGGILKVPILVLIMNIEPHIAVGTSAFMVGVTAFMGSIAYWRSGILNPIKVAAIVPGVLVGAMIGPRISTRLKGSMLRKIFSIVMIVFAILMIIESL